MTRARMAAAMGTITVSGQGLQHTKYAAVPCLRRRPHVGGDFPDFGIYRVEQAGEIAHNAVN